MLGCPPTSITSTRCRSTISTTWPLLGCTTSLETMPQHKWWARSASAQSIMFVSMNSRRLSSGSLRIISIPSNREWPVFQFFFLFPDFSLQSWRQLLLSVIFQVVHEIRNYPYPQLHLLALQSLNPSRHASAVRESYEVRLLLSLLSRHTSLHSFIIVFSVTNALDRLECVTDFLISNYSGFQMPQMVQLPLISWHLFSF